ncbi:MAG: class I tRNA ligase family protein [Patescibacteria group bacterium]
MAERENSNKKSDAALREEAILEFWKENKIFEKSLKKPSSLGEFVFYEGPPTANARPPLHSIEARAFKDVIPRYKTMCGYHVRRKGGWDTHGLPVELQIEKALGLKSKKDIENYGIEAFNRKCRESVFAYISDWEEFTDRIGYWVDKEHSYVTYHNTYMESVWNILKKVNDQNLLYKDYKVVPWCPRCETVLSSHELAQGYEDIKDLSVTVKFHLKAGQTFGKGKMTKETAYILAWTTTPWTLPGNVALAVGKNISYTALRIAGVSELYIIASDRVKNIFEGQNIEIVHGDIKGEDLIGLEYEPLYPYLANNISESEKIKLEKAYKVYEADFVTTEDGTGIVHTAVMYGQDDFELGTKIGLPKHHLVSLDGTFVKGTDWLEGRSVVDETLAVDILKDLQKRNLLFGKENYTHSYPFCWRCKTRLIYYARDSWYIKMSDPKIKKELINQNQEINWEPAHIRDGRFGEWLREIKDWAVSRERYWGTPLPVWFDENNNFRVIGSVDELKKLTKKSGNKYFVMRHGGSIANINNVDSLKPGEENDALTDKGREQVKLSVSSLKYKPDFIVSSDFIRTKQTSKTIADALGISEEKIITSEKLREFRAVTSPDENDTDVRKRMISVLENLEKKYSGKNILIISHEYPLRILLSSYEALNAEEESQNLHTKYPFIQNAEVFPCNFLLLPRNEYGQIDLHRPFIDTLELVDENGSALTRVKEVMDVWFDSGAMPFAQDHYPFENKKWVDGPGYPADFIAEAVDQTRGWFYTLHAIGVLMGRGKAYKNVICLGHLLDAAGKKMSKSLGNIVDPWEAMDKYGVDTLRLWMYCINQPGESKNFDEKTVALLHQQVFGLLYNVLAFYELYRDKKIEKNNRPKSENILDIWILARLDELIKLTTENLDNYKLLEPTRALRDFVSDLSTWYLRRSRERIKNKDKEAKQTLYYVLKTLAKILAPFAPFAAEDIWLKLRNEKDEESVHLAEWSKAEKMDLDLIKNMEIIRKIVSLGLEARQREKIPVRQPLAKLEMRDYKLGKEYFELIKDELNIKEIILNISVSDEIKIDTNITSELKQEGNYRELVRALQNMRKKLGLTPSDVVMITFETNDTGKKLIQKFEADMKKTVLASEIGFKKNDGEAKSNKIGSPDASTETFREIKIDELAFKVKIEK